MSDFGTRLKLARKNKKMTQKELARRLGVEQSAISNYEKNFRFPVASVLKELADLLEVSVDYLLGRSEASPEVSDPHLRGDDHRHPERLKEISEKLKALQIQFFEDLRSGKFEQASALVINHRDPEVKLLDYYEHVIQPTLAQVGRLWAQGELSVAEEHLISSAVDPLMTLLEQKKAGHPGVNKSLTAAFMLPGAEEHAFPLRMTTEVFKQHGWHILYLGRSIPVSSLEDLFTKNKVDLLVLSVTLSVHLNSCETLIRAVKALNPQIRPSIMVGGAAVEGEWMALNQLGADLYLPTLRALDEAMEEIERRLPVLEHDKNAPEQ